MEVNKIKRPASPKGNASLFNQCVEIIFGKKTHCVTFIVGRDQRRCISHLAVTSTWQGDSAHVT